jgi:hypothetical protein
MGNSISNCGITDNERKFTENEIVVKKFDKNKIKNMVYEHDKNINSKTIKNSNKIKIVENRINVGEKSRV